MESGANPEQRCAAVAFGAECVEILPMHFVTLTLAMGAIGQGPSDWYEPFPALATQLEKANQGKSAQVAPPAVSAISDRLRKTIAANEIAGAVTLVPTPDRVIHLD